MKFLTIRQPWASLIAVGAKTLETRPFSTTYRGPLAIHAGLAKPDPCWEGGGYAIATEWAPSIMGARPVRMDFAYEGILQNRLDLPLGAVVAVCDLVDVLPITASAIDGTPTITAMDTPLPGGGSKLILWDDDGRGCVNVSDQLPFGDFTVGRYAWILDNVRPINPVPMKGAQGLRDVPDDIAALLEVEQ